MALYSETSLHGHMTKHTLDAHGYAVACQDTFITATVLHSGI